MSRAHKMIAKYIKVAQECTKCAHLMFGMRLLIKFTRAESEIFGTYSHTSMSRAAGDDLFQWACNEAYSYKDVRYGSMRSLTDAIRKKYVPHGVVSTNFHEPLDGNQYLWLHRRRMLPTLISMLKDPQFAGVQYTDFSIMRNENGCRIFGSFQGGEWH